MHFIVVSFRIIYSAPLQLAYVVYCESFSVSSLGLDNVEVTTLNHCLLWLLGKKWLLPLVAAVKNPTYRKEKDNKI